MKEDYLVHHGVLGMKWGVRKTRETGSKVSRADKKAAKQKLRATNKSLKADYKKNKKKVFTNQFDVVLERGMGKKEIVKGERNHRAKDVYKYNKHMNRQQYRADIGKKVKTKYSDINKYQNHRNTVQFIKNVGKYTALANAFSLSYSYLRKR